MSQMAKIEHGKFLNQNNFPEFVDTFNGLVDFYENIKGDYDKNTHEGSIYVDKSGNEVVIRYKKPTDNDDQTWIKGINTTPSISALGIDDDGKQSLEIYGWSGADNRYNRDIKNFSSMLSVDGIGLPSRVNASGPSGGGRLYYLSLKKLIEYIKGDAPGVYPSVFEPATDEEGQPTGTFDNCCLRLGRKYFDFGTQSASISTTGILHAVVTHNTSTPTLQLAYYGSTPSNTQTVTYCRLFKFALDNDNKPYVQCDYRPLLNIQLYEPSI